MRTTILVAGALLVALHVSARSSSSPSRSPGAPPQPVWPTQFWANLVYVDYTQGNATYPYVWNYDKQLDCDYTGMAEQTEVVSVISNYVRGHRWTVTKQSGSHDTCKQDDISGHLPSPPLNTCNYTGDATIGQRPVHSFVCDNNLRYDQDAHNMLPLRVTNSQYQMTFMGIQTGPQSKAICFPNSNSCE
eukprot:TRINITY_DN1007_c0_g1_i4.p1 TRINITY_DN1007_c0_g1~~TRINITY_DN1007_c0_g1_i4.p1  ORF type:complete len:189 (-),score=43.15 TRINITY_DN1007_c0_g1_i4:113-679(-)